MRPHRLELAVLQSCDTQRDAFQSSGLVDFYDALPIDIYLNIKTYAMQMCTVFGSTYICEQTFSKMKLLKSQKRIGLTDEHLHHALRLAVTRMEPDINLLVRKMQPHSSQVADSISASCKSVSL